MDVLGFGLCRVMSSLGVCSRGLHSDWALTGLSTPSWWSYNSVISGLVFLRFFHSPTRTCSLVNTLVFSLTCWCARAHPKVSCWLSGKIYVVIRWRRKQETFRCHSFSKYWDNHGKQAYCVVTLNIKMKCMVVFYSWLMQCDIFNVNNSGHMPMYMVSWVISIFM